MREEQQKMLFIAGSYFFLLAMLIPSPLYAKRTMEVPENPRVRSASAFVVSVPNGQVIYEKDSDLVRPIASLSKLVSALVYFEDCRVDPSGLKEMTTQSRILAKGGDHSKLTTGWSYSHRDILHAALMRSDNRAFPALMEACGMRLQEFVMRMNLHMARLGLTKTSFSEPNGLSRYNVSTAKEFSRVLQTVLAIPDIAEVLQTEKTWITAHKAGRQQRVEIRNTDRLLHKDRLEVVGGKTGYTDLARYCFAGMARLWDDTRLAMVFLGAEGRYTRFSDFLRVYDWFIKRLSVRLPPKVEEGQASTIGQGDILPQETPETARIGQGHH